MKFKKGGVTLLKDCTIRVLEGSTWELRDATDEGIRNRNSSTLNFKRTTIYFINFTVPENLFFNFDIADFVC